MPLAAFLFVVVAVTVSATSAPSTASEYRRDLVVIMNKYKDVAKHFNETVKQFGADLEAATRPGTDYATGMQKLTQAINTYMAPMRSDLAKLQNSVIEINALKPPPEYAQAHVMLSKGIDYLLQATTSVLNGMEMAKDPATVEEGMNTLDAAMNLGDQAKDLVDEGEHIIFPINWPRLIAIIGGALLLVALSAYMVARTLRRRTPGAEGPPAQVFQGYPPPPQQYSVSEVPPPGTFRGDGDIPLPAPRPKRKRPTQVVVGNATCPGCGAQVAATMPFCPKCRTAIRGL